MKRPDSRDLLINKIDSFIKNSSPYRMKKIEEEIRHTEKITMGTFMQILSGRLSLAELTDAQLYWITFALSNSTNRFGKVEDFFEPAEINNYKYYNPTSEKEIKFPLVFNDVSKLCENQYLFPLAVGDIKRLKSANILQIIPELQRNAKKDKYGDLKTKVNKETARQISGLIDSGGFYYNGVRFNLMNDGECDPPIYDEDNKTLTVSGGTIIVPDGNHRTISCELATKHLDDKFGVFFTYLSAQETRLLLNQEWTTVPIPKRHKEAMRPTKANRILDSIMRSPDIDDIYVKGIVKDGIEIRANNGFVLYIELSTAIQKNYNTEELETKADQDEVRDWIISYMNYLAKLLFNDFSDYATVKRNSWSVHYLAWYYYMMISKHIKSKSNWRDILTKIISETDFTGEMREAFYSNNKRRVLDYCKEREEEICIMLNKSNCS